MTSHPLHTRIQQVARNARGLVLLHGVCWFVALVVMATLGLALADYFLRYREVGARVLSSMLWVATCGWALWRFLVPVLAYKLEDVSVAQRVEWSFPQFRDRLSSSIQFLAHRGGNAQMGSIDLQQAVVAEAERLAEGLDFSDCLNSRATRQAAMFAVPVVLLAAAVFAADRDSSQLALRRLALPWSLEAWPRWNQLYFEETPTRLAAGQDFTVAVRDANHHLPSTVVMQYWFAGDSEDQIENYRMARSKNAMSHHRKNITRSFQYRAIGGDDDTMAWLPLQVVEPAAVEEFNVHLQPPPHSGLPATELSAGAIDALQGTTIEVTGRASRRVAAAELIVEGVEQPIEVNAELATDGREFRIPAWPIKEPGLGQYWLRLTEPDGVTGGYGTRATWRVVPDLPPEITVHAPPADDIVTANAVVTVRGIVSDDLAVASVVLNLGGNRFTLYQGPDLPPAKEVLGQRDEREIAFACQLGPLDLQPQVLPMSLTASDYAGHQLTTEPRSLRIVTADEFGLVLQERQKRLKQQLAEALRIQTAIQTQTTSLQTQLTQVGVLSEADVAMLRGTELQQRQVQRLLAEQDDGAAMLVAELVASVESNRVDETRVAARLADFATRLRSINEQSLPGIRSDLVRSGKALEAAEFRSAAVIGLLKHASQNQNDVVESLQEMVHRLSEWDDYRQFLSDFGVLLRSQQDLKTRADELTTLGKRLDDLTSSERSDLIRLSTEQGALSRQFDRLLANMVLFAQPLGEAASSPPTGRAQVETLLSAARMAGEQAVAEHMLQAKLTLAQNQLGTARREIGQAQDGLQAIVDVLAGRSEDDMVRTRRLAKVGEELDALTSAQGDLRKQFGELDNISNPKARQEAARNAAQQQADLADQAAGVAEALRSLKAADAAASVEHGMERARQASELAGDGQTADAARAAEDAERRFAEASQEVADELKQSREQALRQSLARFLQAVTKLAKTQRALQDRFLAEHDRREEREAAATLETLARQQHALGDATDSTREEFQPPQVFGLALTWAARSMREAAAKLSLNAPEEEIAALQSDAARRLQALLETLPAAGNSGPNSEASDGNPDGQGEGKPARYSEAELRVVLGMQTEIHDQTNQLEKESRGSPGQDGEYTHRRQRLAADQEQLSEVVAELAALPESDASASQASGASQDTSPQESNPLDQALEQAVKEGEVADPAASDLDPRLLDGLIYEAAPRAGEDLGQQSERDPLSIVSERMGHVARHIIEDETLQPAQQLQQEILRELSRLAEEAAQQSQQTSRGASTPRPSQQGDGPASSGTATGSSPAGDPIEAVWGTLPERVRKGIRSPLQEEFLPEYKHIIQEYYKRLSEQRRSRSDR